MKLKQQFERLSPNYLTIQPRRPPLTKKNNLRNFCFAHVYMSISQKAK